MVTSDISGIGKVIVQGQTADVKGSTQEEELKIAFTEVMSQMSAMVGERSETRGQTGVDTEFAVTSSTADAEYERCGSRGVKIQENSKSELKREELSEKTEKFAKDVEEVLKEELGVSKERIEEAMATLGLNFSDLLNPNQLAYLVAELTGTENMSELLCSEQFMSIMQEVGTLSENLLQELGVTAEELAQMLDASESMIGTESDEQLTQTTGAAQTAGTMDDAVTNVDKMQKGVDEATDASGAHESSGHTDGKLTVDEKIQDEESSGENVVHVAEDTEESAQSETGRDETFSKHQNANESGVQARNDMTGSMNQNITGTAFSQMQDMVGETAPQVDVAEIMKQIVEYSKVTINNQATTMEMQLNPENLGKLYMEITSKDGMVSARITAQNEAVKEALESQLVELRQSLNQAGVKVEAVEVTVESHEFEKNLEQNTKQQENQAEQQEKVSKQTRRINLNDLDELNGLMTEEESLVAQMMADQGNSIDYTA